MSDEVTQQERVQEAESRRSVRRPCDFEVLVSRQGESTISARLRDLSLAGAFVANLGKLSKGSDVDLVLHYRRGNGQVELRLAATVARVEPEGAALAFGNYDNYRYTDLANLLYAR
jgi:hypothetical protein